MEASQKNKKKLYKLIEKICGAKSNCITIACGESEWKQGLTVCKESTYISNGINMSKMDRILETLPLIGKNHQFCKESTYISNGINMSKMDRILETLPLIGKNHQYTVYTLGRVTYQKNPGKNHQYTVYTLGRVTYQKNPEMFNEIAKRLPDIRFVWIGAGELEDKLTAPNIFCYRLGRWRL
ncbi:hypothetical protein DXA21_20830 [Parabacteroides distasonis]|nr:hypothetical protein DXA21_20830 [Parabacteroides distasonis]